MTLGTLYTVFPKNTYLPSAVVLCAIRPLTTTTTLTCYPALSETASAAQYKLCGEKFVINLR